MMAVKESLNSTWRELAGMNVRQYLMQAVNLGGLVPAERYNSAHITFHEGHRAIELICRPDRDLSTDDLEVDDSDHRLRVPGKSLSSFDTLLKVLVRSKAGHHNRTIEQVVVVLSGSMEPAFYRGDILFLNMGKKPLRTGEIVVFNIDGRDIPIVHRIIKIHERTPGGRIDILTKGDANLPDDRGLYAEGQMWLHKKHIIGRVIGFLPHIGRVTIIMNDFPMVKYALIGVLGLFVILSKE